MKTLRPVIVAMVLSLISLTTRAGAADRSVNGLILGAGGGAILGQAIGRDTEGTLLGTAVGGVLGYIVGNEMDKYDGWQAAGPSRTVIIERGREEDCDAGRLSGRHAPHSPGPDCQQTEMLAMINGRPRVVVTTACREGGAWVLAEQRRTVERELVVIRNVDGSRFRRVGPPSGKLRGRRARGAHRWH